MPFRDTSSFTTKHPLSGKNLGSNARVSREDRHGVRDARADSRAGNDAAAWTAGARERPRGRAPETDGNEGAFDGKTLLIPSIGMIDTETDDDPRRRQEREGRADEMTWAFLPGRSSVRCVREGGELAPGLELTRTLCPGGHRGADGNDCTVTVPDAQTRGPRAGAPSRTQGPGRSGPAQTSDSP